MIDELMADGADSTRVVVRVTDEFGAVRPGRWRTIPLSSRWKGRHG